MVFTVAKLVPIVVLIAVGVFRLHGDLFVPFALHGFGSIAPATMVILFAFVGFETLTVHPRTQTPVIAMVVTAAITLALALTGTFASLAVLSIAARLTVYMATCAAMLWFRAKRPDDVPAFRAPGGVVVAILAMGICAWLLLEAEPAHLLGGLVAVAVGLAIHLPLRRRVPSPRE